MPTEQDRQPDGRDAARRGLSSPGGLAPGLLVAAPRSGSGKTIVTLGLARALARRGQRIRAVKSGPDYIDAAFHEAATGRQSLNLDGFAMGRRLLSALAAEAARSCDLILAEGAMGLHDGALAANGPAGTSGHLAALLGWPVVLVLDVSGQGATAAAVAQGLARFDPRIRVAGAILNRVASERHRRLVESGFARTGMPVLGALPRNPALHLPERHLGLVQAAETTGLRERLDAIADIVERHVDLDAALAAAAPTAPLLRPAEAGPALPPPGGRIALARDEAFSFVYPHLVEGWRLAGATILPFSPLADEPPPGDADCCWLPGGYPELHAGRIGAAARFREGLRLFAGTRPVHGECGGYMVLGEALEDADGKGHAMAGLLPLTTGFARRKLHLGYRIARLERTCALGAAGTVVAGHEFHYASIDPDRSAPANLAAMRDAEGRDLGLGGHRRGLVSGSFFHVIASRDDGVGA